MSNTRNASRKPASPSTRPDAGDPAADLAIGDSDGTRTALAGNSSHRGEVPPPLRPLSDYDYTNFYFGAGTDPFTILEPFGEWWKGRRVHRGLLSVRTADGLRALNARGDRRPQDPGDAAGPDQLRLLQLSGALSTVPR